MHTPAIEDPSPLAPTWGDGEPLTAADLVGTAQHSPFGPMPILSVGGSVIEASAPLMSFVLINWNYGRFIADAIRSIREQDYPRFECIIVDNGSTDDSIAIAEKAIAGDPRLRLLRLPQNLGQLGGVMTGLNEVVGTFIAVIDSDDVLLPSFASLHIQVHLALLDAVAVTTSQVIEVGATTSALTSGRQRLTFAGDPPVLPSADAALRLSTVSDSRYSQLTAGAVSGVRRDVPGWIWSPGTANVFRRSVLELFLTDPHSFRMRTGDDYLLPLCHALGGTVGITIPLSLYRVHGSNLFSAREWILGIQKQGAPAKDGTANRLENLRAALSDPKKFRWMLGPHYWTALDVGSLTPPKGRRRFYTEAAVRSLLTDRAADLLKATGLHEFTHNIVARVGFAEALPIIRSAHGGRLPGRALVVLLGLMRRRVWKRGRKRRR